MLETNVRIVDKPWDGSKRRYSIDQLQRAVPKAILRRAHNLGGPTKENLICHYREPNGEINRNGVEAALDSLGAIKGLSMVERAAVRSELRRYQVRELRNPLEELSDLGSEFLMALSQAEPEAEEELLAKPMVDATMPPRHTPDMSALMEMWRRHAPTGVPETGYQSAVLNTVPQEGSGQNMSGLPPFAMMEGEPPIPLSEGEHCELASAAVATARKGMPGVVDNDYRPLPNYRSLGIERAGGDATPAEIAYLSGATRMDGTPLAPSDVYSVGALLANNDIVPQLMCYIPRVELARLGIIIRTRALKSDQDHSRTVSTGNFTLIEPMIGSDPESKMHMDHPELGVAPYTALTARALFQKIPEDPQQMAAVASVMAARFQNLSIAFGHGGITCALCGEMPVIDTVKAQDKVIAFTIAPESNQALCQVGDCGEYSFERPCGIIRTPADTEGGFVYKNVRIVNAGADGTMQIEPQAAADFVLAKGSVFMLKMDSGWSWFFGAMCKIHGRVGNYGPDGRRTVGMFTNMRAFINTALVDKGAINDARLVPDPDKPY